MPSHSSESHQRWIAGSSKLNTFGMRAPEEGPAIRRNVTPVIVKATLEGLDSKNSASELQDTSGDLDQILPADRVLS